VNCPNCHFENREQAGFCGNCGVRLVSLCPQCGAENRGEQVFCDRCGFKLGQIEKSSAIDYSQPQSYTPKYLAERILTARSSIEGERKIVTVLFTDVANYTSMSEQLDPEEVHRIMDGYFRILVDEVYRHEGTIDKFTGDGVMALFGAPLAHEDHAQRACHAALAIRRAMGEYGKKVKKDCGVEFTMRVGLNSGLVIVGTIGDDLKMDYTAIGDTTNLASRMETTAAPGTIRVSEKTHRLARDYFEFKSLGEVMVKGKEKTQPAFELLRPGKVATRFEASVAMGLTRFVGRRKQMEALQAAFQQACAGAGRVVGIVGEAGVGKSRLLLEFRNRLPKEGCTYLQGSCLHFGGATPYLPILDILKSHFDIQEEDREYMIKKKVRERLSRLDEKLLASLPFFHELLSVPVEDEKHLQLEPQERRQRTFEAIRDLLIRESQPKPLLIILEDLHWIDMTSRQFLDYLTEWLANSRILLVLLYRPEYTHSWGSKSYCTQISLGQLSVRTSVELVQAILEEGEVVPELKELILGKAGGNPLFVEELTRSLLENGSILRKDNQYVLTRKVSEIEVPETIQGIIASRMDRIEESLKRIIQVASVIGREFAFRLLAQINGMREELTTSLLQLQGLDFIYEKQLFPELEYIFKHALTQEVAYNSLLLKRRRELHGKIGEATEQVYADRLAEYYELLAYHYVHSDNRAKAVGYLDLANKKAASANAMEDAKGYFDKAMELLDALPDNENNRKQRVSLLVNQDKVFFGLVRVSEYYDLLVRHEPTATHLDDVGLRGQFCAVLGYCELTLGYLDQAIKTSTKAARLCEAAGNREATGYAIYISAFAHFLRADYERVLELMEEALRVTAEISLPRARLRAYWIGCLALSRLGRWEEALEVGQKALMAESDISDTWGWAGMALSYAHTQKRNPDRAIDYGQSALGRAQTLVSRTMVQHILGLALCHGGRTDEGIELLAGLRPLCRATRTLMMEILVTLYLTEGYWLAGEHEKCSQTAEELLKIAEPLGARFEIGHAHFFLAGIARETDPAQAATHFEKSIAVFQEIKAENALALAYAGFGRLHGQQGKVEEARGYLTKALEIFERLGTLIEPDKVRRELAELPSSA
jgi:class 3 adenylate cyclase/tetratricopeptide (TPR) repeat protein